MNGIGVSAVNAYTAHREWASRPPDERYASVHALYEAARARRIRTEERTIETVARQDRSGRRPTRSRYATRRVARPPSRTGASSSSPA